MHKENWEIVVENAELIYDFEDVENYELAKGWQGIVLRHYSKSVAVWMKTVLKYYVCIYLYIY